MQTILGAGGAMGIQLAQTLTHYTKEIRLVSRHPKKINQTDILMSANITQRDAIFKAVEGSRICYVTVGFPYQTSAWEKYWLPCIQHIVDACAHYACKLVFFDNVYALDRYALSNITEDTPIGPSSKKGKVRAGVDAYILQAIAEGRIEAIIARSPDFFGYDVLTTSMLMNLIYLNYKKGKSAQWFGNVQALHTMGYTPDLAKGLALLGNTADAYQQIWNLPCSDEALNAIQWAALFGKAMNTEAHIRKMPAWLLRVGGIFVPMLGELYEMNYQFENDYVFNSTKFKKRFNFITTSNEEAVNEVVKQLSEEN